MLQMPIANASTPLANSATSPTAQSSNKARRASLKVLNRNIDQVVLGNLLFKTWYYSPYPDSIILDDHHLNNTKDIAAAPIALASDPATNGTAARVNLGPFTRRHSHLHSTSEANGTDSQPQSPAPTELQRSYFSPLPGSHNDRAATSRIDHAAATGTLPPAPNTITTTALPANVTSTICRKLYVCPYCFRYTSRPQGYVRHLHRHSVTYDPYSSALSVSPQQLKSEDVVGSGSHDASVASPASGVITSNRVEAMTRSGRHKQREVIEDDEEEREDSELEEDTSDWPVPGSAVKVYEHGGYTVWDIDGEQEKLYCQNLSLFGKLFLEQKSVFFDTCGFHYFVLTYTPPPGTSFPPVSAIIDTKLNASSFDIKSPIRAIGRKRGSSGPHASTDIDIFAGRPPRETLPMANSVTPIPVPAEITLSTHVLGFFSKETLSWDSNNLACILVFPPYQHRNLGQLLMAISYKLSGWEWEDSIIGGPEKPLSAMGRKSYLRFWSERVARFMMGQTADADGRRVFGGEIGSNADDEEKIHGRHRHRTSPNVDGDEEDEDVDDAGEVVVGDDDERANGNDEGNTSRKRKRRRKRRRRTGVAGVRRKKRRIGFDREEMTVKDIGDRTGMLAEDVVAALNEMGVLDAVSPQKKTAKKMRGDNVAEHGVTVTCAYTDDHKGSGGVGMHSVVATATTTHEEEINMSSTVVHRTKVLEWAMAKGVDLVSPVKEEGFLGEWALSEADEHDDDDSDGEAGMEEDQSDAQMDGSER